MRKGLGAMTNKDNEKNSLKSEFSKVPDLVQDGVHRQLFEFWDQARGPRLLPNTTDIDPSQIAPILKDVAIFDVNGPMSIQYRLAGTGISARMGEDPTGKDLIQMTSPESRETIARAFNLIVSHPVAALGAVETIYNSGMRAMVLSFYLPMRKAEGHSDRILSVHSLEETLSYEGERDHVTVAEKLLYVNWIDIGAGCPEKLSL